MLGVFVAPGYRVWTIFRFLIIKEKGTFNLRMGEWEGLEKEYLGGSARWEGREKQCNSILMKYVK